MGNRVLVFPSVSFRDVLNLSVELHLPEFRAVLHIDSFSYMGNMRAAKKWERTAAWGALNKELSV